MEWFIKQGKSPTPDGALQQALEYEVFKNGRQRRHGPKAVIRGQVESNCGNELDAHSSAQVDEIVDRITKLILNSSVPPATKHEICGSLTDLKRECSNLKSKSERAWVENATTATY